MFRSLALLAFVVCSSNAFAHPTFPGAQIHYDRCGSANTKITLCVARSETGHVYVVTLVPNRGPGFVPVTETFKSGVKYDEQVLTGTMAILLETNGGIFEHTIELTLHTSAKTPWTSEGSMTMDGAPYYPHIELSQSVN